MKETIDKLITFLETDNKNFLLEFPDEDPILIYTKATDEEINHFEKRFNLVLPDCLREFYKNFNSVESNFMFTQILGTTNLIADYETYPSLQELVDDKIIPIANDNGDLICIDTKRNENWLMHFSHDDGSLSETYVTIEAFIEDLIKQKIELTKRKG